MKGAALLNGQRVPWSQASADRLQGITCFETVALAGGQLVCLEEHLARLGCGLVTLGLEPEGGVQGVGELVRRATEETELQEGIVRVSVHAAGTPVGLALEDRSADVLVLITPARYTGLAEGVRAVTSSRLAPDPASVPTGFKAPNLARWLAFDEATAAGAFEALMLDAQGSVVSGTRSNCMAVIDGRIVTPPAPPALPGINRARLIEAPGLEVEIRAIPASELAAATEVLITFTGPGVVPVVDLDGKPVGDGRPGPVYDEVFSLLTPRC